MVNLLIYTESAADASTNYEVLDLTLANLGREFPLQEPVMTRQVRDLDNNHGSIDALLDTCLRNGHDRHKTDQWGADAVYFGAAVSEGYDSSQVLWAEVVEVEGNVGYREFDFTRTGNVLLVIDPALYEPVQGNLVHGQKDAETRREALLGIAVVGPSELTDQAKAYAKAHRDRFACVTYIS